MQVANVVAKKKPKRKRSQVRAHNCCARITIRVEKPSGPGRPCAIKVTNCNTRHTNHPVWKPKYLRTRKAAQPKPTSACVSGWPPFYFGIASREKRNEKKYSETGVCRFVLDVNLCSGQPPRYKSLLCRCIWPRWSVVQAGKEGS